MATGGNHDLALFLIKYQLGKYLDPIVKMNINTVIELNSLSKQQLKEMGMKKRDIEKFHGWVKGYLEKGENTVVMGNCYVESEQNLNLDKMKKLSLAKEATKFECNTTVNKYTMISIYSKERVIDNFEEQMKRKKFNEYYCKSAFPLFYYLKCGLSFENVSTYWSHEKFTGVNWTDDVIFHSIFQQSEPLVRALCIYDYSLNFPIPFYYPILSSISNTNDTPVFKICHELWFTFPECLAFASFGIGRAGWYPAGKSTLLDKLFNTKFMENKRTNSPYHSNSIDVQIYQDLPKKKLAIFDCHSGVKPNVINALIKCVGILLIHILHEEIENNKLIEEVINFSKFPDKKVIVLIRDYREHLEFRTLQTISSVVVIPDLKAGCNQKKLIRDIAEVFKAANQLVDQSLIENIMKELKETIPKEILESKEQIEKMIEIVNKNLKPGDCILPFYPKFVRYMNSYQKANSTTNQEMLVKFNEEHSSSFESLKKCQTSQITKDFLDLVNSEYSPLLLRRFTSFLKQLSLNASHDKSLSMDILWRETLLSFKYDHTRNAREQNEFQTKLQHCFAKQIMNSEPIEIIDGDNLVFHSKDLDILLQEFYTKQKEMLDSYNEGKDVKLSAAPIVISILGRQNSGKSTLLNYLFGCRFLVHTSRCTKGVYGTFFQLKECVNNSKTLLILDTEGLYSNQRKDSMEDAQIDFNKILTLFCFAVSQVVIINIKDDINTEVKDLLEVCAYSINRLKINKVPQAKIIFVLNQQIDLEVENFTSSMESLMKILERPVYTAFSEPMEVSDLIDMTLGDLSILPQAFNLIPFNSPFCKDEHEELRRIELTEVFLKECGKLKEKVFTAIRFRPKTENPAFENISEWIQMAGLVWETCIKCQDIVLYSRVEEIEFAQNLKKEYHKIIDEEIYRNEPIFLVIMDDIIKEIKKDKKLDPVGVLVEKVQTFDSKYESYDDKCLMRFKKLENDILKFRLLFEDAETNLKRLIYNKKKGYHDQIELNVKFNYIECLLTKNIRKFKNEIATRVDKCIVISPIGKTDKFQEIWEGCFNFNFETELNKEQYLETLYANFRTECNYLDSLSIISETFQMHNYKMDEIIAEMETNILEGLMNFEETPENWFFCTLTQSYGGFTQAHPHESRCRCHYLSPDSLTHFKDEIDSNSAKKQRILNEWIPEELSPIVDSLSGDYNSHDIIWKKWTEKVQILRLVSQLKNPNNPAVSCWIALMEEVKLQADFLLEKDAELSQSTIKILVQNLKTSTRVVNHEIKHIRAMLSHRAERAFTTLLFSYAFRVFWEHQEKQRSKKERYFDARKKDLQQYFLQKIDNAKMLSGRWDGECMRANDLKISKTFAVIYIESIKRLILNDVNSKVKERFEKEKHTINVEGLIKKAEAMISEEIEKHLNDEITDTNHFVVEYFCDRNVCLQKLYHHLFSELQVAFDNDMCKYAKTYFQEFISPLEEQFRELLGYFNEHPEIKGDTKSIYPNYNFTCILPESEQEPSTQTKEAPFLALSKYLSKLLDPSISSTQFSEFLGADFEIDDVRTRVRTSNNFIFPIVKLRTSLPPENFTLLENTGMFYKEPIFNIYSFIENFLNVLGEETINFSLDSDFTHQIFRHLRNLYLKDALGCDMRCPGCGKFCEKETHEYNDKNCQILRGHQLSSMGGKVWKNDTEKSAVLFLCDDYEDHMPVKVPGEAKNWKRFKKECGSNWNWEPPEYETSKSDHKSRMQKIWNIYGRGILNYYSKKGTHITYIPLTLNELKSIASNHYICFLIDGTGSMGEDIERARISVSKIVNEYQNKKIMCYFRVVIYRDHCDEEIIATCPQDSSFCDKSELIIDFLDSVIPDGGGDGPEAMLDGLANAVCKSDWHDDAYTKNILVHIYDAPPHGDFPAYHDHSEDSFKSHCCCCNRGTKCFYDWDENVWNPMKEQFIFYNGITTFKRFEGFELMMKEKIGELCREFQMCDKEQVDEAVLKIFIDFS